MEKEEKQIEEKDAKAELDAVQLNAKVKKNLLWAFLFASIMLFAAFTSAYIVSSGSEFWVRIKMPTSFNFSYVVIAISSIFLVCVRYFIRKNNFGLVKLFLGLALVFGISFGYFQYQGWKQLFASGNAVSDHIINQSGRYGQFYSLTYQGKEITYKDEEFYWAGEVLSPELKKELNTFCTELMDGAQRYHKTHDYNLTNYGVSFVLSYENQVVTYLNKKLLINNIPLNLEQHDRLWKFAECIVNGRGDFMLIGKYGEDFTIYYKGEPLEYKNRTFYMKGKKLSPKQDNDLNGSKNKNSSYIYVFTGMHLLHWVGGIIALLVMFIKGLQLKYTKDNYLGIQLGSTYWHFLGILWVYLYVFLIFIH